MSKFNSTSHKSVNNLAGGKAYVLSKEIELAHSVLTTFLNNKFYESGDERIERIRNLIQQCDPKFVAKLAVLTRQEFNLRSINHVLLGELSKIDNTYVREATIASIVRPDDILEIIAYCDGKLSKQLQRGLRRSLYKFSPYQLAKYKSQRKKVKLVDAFNMLHPNPKFASDEQANAWKLLIKGELKNTETWESDIQLIPKLIKENKMPYMALLRNLNNIIKYKWDEIIPDVCKRLTDEKAILNSRQLPFRFWTAYKNVTGNIALTDAIVKAAEISLKNVPRFEGKTLVAIDTSGSMMGRPITIASLFGASLARSNHADLILYDTDMQDVKFSTLSTIIELAEKIQSLAKGGGTNTALVFEHARDKYDRIIILSDNESWVSNAQQAYKTYIPKDVFVYCIDIQGYGTTDVRGDNVFHIPGWSNAMFELIKVFDTGNGIVDYIYDYDYQKFIDFKYK